MGVRRCSLYTAVVLLAMGAPRPLVAQAPPAVLQPAILRQESPPAKPDQSAASAPPAKPASNVASGVQAPALQLEEVGPATVNVGQPCSYEIVLRNVGFVPVFDVRVDDQLPAGARYVSADPRPDVQGDRLSWTVGTLEAGAERRFKVQVVPATEGEIQSRATVTCSSSTNVRTRITKAQLTLSKTGPANVHVGDPVPFQIQITNIGTGPATHVLLHDQLPAGLKHDQGQVVEADVGTLAAGESKSVTLQTTAVQVGRQVNEALVTADGGIQAPARAEVLVTQSGLKLRKDGPQQRFIGREAEYDLEVYNPGSAPAISVRVTDQVPEGLDFGSASDGGTYDAAKREVLWTLGTLAPGQRRGLTLHLQTRTAGDWVNHALAQADRGLEDRAESSLHIDGVPALMLEVVDIDDPVEVGAETSYEIRVVNQGTCACTGLRILATVPAEMEPRDAEGPSPHQVHGQQVLFDALPTLAAKADAVYRVQVRGVRPGDVRFKVQMSCDQLTLPVYEEESTRVYDDER
jgi:uncharacterized repeat protein (TIGR01451 family)